MRTTSGLTRSVDRWYGRRAAVPLTFITCLALAACGQASRPEPPAAADGPEPQPQASAATPSAMATVAPATATAPPPAATTTVAAPTQPAPPTASLTTAGPTTAVAVQPPAADPTPFPPSTAEQVLAIARAALPEFRDNVRSSVGRDGEGSDFHSLEELEQATLLTQSPNWVVPVLMQGEGRSSMAVSFFHNPGGDVGEWVGNYESAALVQLQALYTGRAVAISYILNETWAPNLVLVTEGQEESLIVLRPQRRPQTLDPRPADQVMPGLVEQWTEHEAGCLDPPNPPCTG